MIVDVELPDDMELTRTCLQEAVVQALEFKAAEHAEASLTRIRTVVELVQAIEGAYQARLAAAEEEAKKLADQAKEGAVAQ